jgi:hypothetical protein
MARPVMSSLLRVLVRMLSEPRSRSLQARRPLIVEVLHLCWRGLALVAAMLLSRAGPAMLALPGLLPLKAAPILATE